MPPNITRVRWSAANLPWGISFDEQTGTFSGIPEDVGEYIVPVKVETNYGQDQKDVKIIVEDAPYSVYAIGSYAASWSGGATPDDNGFYKLNMPKASALTSLNYGFGAKTQEGMYICGTSPVYFGYSKNELDVSTPVRFPVDNVVEIASASNVTSTSTSTGSLSLHKFLYRTQDNVCYIRRSERLAKDGAQVYHRYEGEEARSSVKMLSSCIGANNRSGAAVDEDNEILYCAGGSVSLSLDGVASELPSGDSIKKIYCTDEHAVTYLTNGGKVYNLVSGSGIEEVDIPVAAEMVKDIFAISPNSTKRIFISTKDGELYVRPATTSASASTNSIYGLPTTTGYPDFTFVGYFNVKKIVPYTFMLTEDGKLYHTGSSVSKITPKHTLFTQIFPEYNFQDICYAADKTLVVTIKE